MAAAGELLRGGALYRDAWFDKPPLLAAAYLLCGARAGWPVRVAGAAYALLVCALVWLFAREVWGRPEAFWAATLAAFALIFYLPSAVIPVAADLLMVAPHVAAVWLAWKGRAFWGGTLAGVAFLVNPKGVFVLAACALWCWRALPALAAGFLLPNAAAVLWMWRAGALADYWEQVWLWGRVYASGTFVAEPLRNGLLRTLAWAGFHAALVIAAVWAICTERKGWRWAAWAALSLVAVAAGWRFFPRYFFQLLPVMALAAGRGMARSKAEGRAWLLVLLVAPLVRFGPRYVLLAQGAAWNDTAMDRDSRTAAALIRQAARPGDTLFVWGFRPEMYVYTGLPAGTRFLDSQPLTGVPADRHLTQTFLVAGNAARAHRAELARSRPTFVVDGLGPYNPLLAPGQFPGLRSWLAQYRPLASTAGSVVYLRVSR